MRMGLLLAMGIGLTLAIRASAADAKDSDKGKDPPSKEGVGTLLGTWVIVSGEEDGKPSPEEKIKGSKMTVDKKSIKLTDKDEKQLWVIEYQLDKSKKPAEITMTVAEGPGAGKSSPGIYEVDGDTL